MDSLKAKDKLYRYEVIWSVVFAVLCVTVLLVFKWNETALDTYSAVVMRGEKAVSIDETSIARQNMKVTLVDRKSSQLVLRLTQPVAQDNIEVTEDFTEHKLIVTLRGAASDVKPGSQMITDSSIMEAAGVYRRQEDIVIEIYCKDAYAYELTHTEDAITVSFAPLRSRYRIVSVVYISAQDRNRLRYQDEQALDRLAQQYGMKIYASYKMQKDYTQQEVVEFANQIHADMILGLEVDKALGTDMVTTLCNPEYFIPDMGGVELAAMMTDSLCRVYNVKKAQVTAADSNCPLVMQATVPSALAVYYSGQDTTDWAELEYDLNRKLMTALANMLEQILQAYYI